MSLKDPPTQGEVRDRQRELRSLERIATALEKLVERLGPPIPRKETPHD